jgi:hypothetical protein
MVKLKRGWLQQSPDDEGENPRREKAHEGHGLRDGLNNLP